jgi:hypothetical protein
MDACAQQPEGQAQQAAAAAVLPRLPLLLKVWLPLLLLLLARPLRCC